VIKIISLGTEEKPVNKKREGEGCTKKNKPTLFLLSRLLEEKKKKIKTTKEICAI
jgi:hypothetical protein